MSSNSSATMKIMKRGITFLLIVVAICFVGFSMPRAQADPLKSSHYQFDETVLGGSGLSNSQSANFQSSQSSGILGVNDSTGNFFQVKNGHETTNEPALTFAITSSAVSFGAFSPSTATVGTSTFEIINYTSYGYVVQIIGNTPTATTGGHTIAAMASIGPSQAGTEQFGINLVANTSPVSLGANPDHGQFGFGSAATNYDSSNNYRFVSGETIALAPKSSGKTIYTISYLVNVNSLTPASEYTSNQTIVCTGTY